MLVNKQCYERGCACYDYRVDTDAVHVSRMVQEEYESQRVAAGKWRRGYNAEYAEKQEPWGDISDAALIEEVRRRGFSIADGVISAEKQEPVAWLEISPDGIRYAYIDYGEGIDSDDIAKGWKYLPLYTAPPQPEGCAECGKKSSDGFALYCVKCSEPVREWQGLTPEEAKEISLANRPYVVDMVRALEQRLKEKNT